MVAAFIVESNTMYDKKYKNKLHFNTVDTLIYINLLINIF